MSCIKPQEDQRKKEVQEMARLMLHRHYCRNDEEAFIAWMDDDIVWIGAGTASLRQERLTIKCQV